MILDIGEPNLARHRTRPRVLRSMGFGNSNVSFALHPRRRAGSVRWDRYAAIYAP
jgi:hypothetical protein